MHLTSTQAYYYVWGWSAGKAPAVRVASALLKAYGELRQLAPLLESLVAALGSAKCPEPAFTVIRDPHFQMDLCKVSRKSMLFNLGSQFKPLHSAVVWPQLCPHHPLLQ